MAASLTSLTGLRQGLPGGCGSVGQGPGAGCGDVGGGGAGEEVEDLFAAGFELLDGCERRDVPVGLARSARVQLQRLDAALGGGGEDLGEGLALGGPQPGGRVVAAVDFGRGQSAVLLEGLGNLPQLTGQVFLGAVAQPREVGVVHVRCADRDGGRLGAGEEFGGPRLLAVSASSNRAKGDQGPEAWKPPNRQIWCAYARAWTDVKTACKLAVTTAEKSALNRMLDTCTTEAPR